MAYTYTYTTYTYYYFDYQRLLIVIAILICLPLAFSLFSLVMHWIRQSRRRTWYEPMAKYYREMQGVGMNTGYAPAPVAAPTYPPASYGYGGQNVGNAGHNQYTPYAVPVNNGAPPPPPEKSGGAYPYAPHTHSRHGSQV